MMLRTHTGVTKTQTLETKISDPEKLRPHRMTKTQNP